MDRDSDSVLGLGTPRQPSGGRLALLASLALAACAGTAPRRDEPAGPPLLLQEELGGMTGVHACGDLWIGAGPAAGDLILAARRGVALVIDLCPQEAREFDAALVCAKQGMRYVAEPIGPEGPSAEAIDRVLAELRAHADQPALLTSRTGSEAAFVLALYRATHFRLDLDAALAEGRRAGMKPEAEALVAEHVARLQAG